MPLPITLDNGGEFAEHKVIEVAMEGKSLFCPPVLILEVLPERAQQWTVAAVHLEGADLREVTDEEIR